MVRAEGMRPSTEHCMEASVKVTTSCSSAARGWRIGCRSIMCQRACEAAMYSSAVTSPRETAGLSHGLARWIASQRGCHDRRKRPSFSYSTSIQKGHVRHSIRRTMATC